MPAKPFTIHLESVVPQRMSDLHIPGAAVALIEKGRVAAIRSFGLADTQNRMTVSETTLFRLASI